MRAQGWPVEQITLISCKPSGWRWTAWATGSPSRATTIDARTRWIFQRSLPGEVVSFVHDAAQRDARLLHCADMAGDVHQDPSLGGHAQQNLGQSGFKGDRERELT